MKIKFEAKKKLKRFKYDRCGIIYQADILPVISINLIFRKPFIEIKLEEVRVKKWYCGGNVVFKEIPWKDVPDSVTDNLPAEAWEYFEYKSLNWKNCWEQK